MLILPLNLFSSLVLRSYRGRLLRNWWRKLSPRVFRWLKKQKWRVRATCALHLRFVCLLVCFWLLGLSYVRVCVWLRLFVFIDSAVRFVHVHPGTDVFQCICLKYQSHKSVRGHHVWHVCICAALTCFPYQKADFFAVRFTIWRRCPNVKMWPVVDYFGWALYIILDFYYPLCDISISYMRVLCKTQKDQLYALAGWRETTIY